MLKNLSNQVSRAALKISLSAALLLVIAVAANAYTLVFKSGQRVEIPDEFTLTRTTLTYEISPGFNKTLVLTLIDVPATERANRGAPGSFYQHREQAAATNANESPQRAVKTLTNIDLAAVRQRRVESEQAYEKRRQELGLPTVAETRQRQDAEGAALRAQIREDSFNKKQEESYWRGRARQLRNEIAAVDTQINYLRGQISELNQTSLNNQSIVTGVYPIWPNNRGRLGNGRWGVYPGQLPGYPYPTARPGYGYPNIYGNPNIYGYPNIYGSPNIYGYPNVYGNPGLYDNSANQQRQSELTYRMDDLMVRRAGLQAQWQTLEDEARDARVPQVWLEP